MNKILIEDFFLLLVFLMYVVAGYFYMKKLDRKIKKSRITNRVLVYQEDEDKETENIKYSTKYGEVKENFDTFIACGKDDLKNLMMAFEIRQVNPLCKVYSFCNNRDYTKLYQSKGIEIIENLEEFERIVESVKEKHSFTL